MTKLVLIAMVTLAVSCNTPSNEPATVVSDTAASVTAKHDYGVKFAYSGDLGIGDVSLADKVVNLWKHFDANTLDSVKSYFADSVSVHFTGMEVTKFSRDSLFTMVKAERGAMSSCVTEFDAIVPLKANDKGENVVSVWGVETATIKGKKIVRDLNEIWAFNKDGKIDFLKQYVLLR